MRNPCSLIPLVALVFWAATALAEPDTFGLGTGRDGALTVKDPRTVINRYAQVTAPLAPGDTVLSVSSTEGFAAGDLIMVLQTTGLVPEPVRGAPGPIALSNDPVGRWELARVSSADGEELKLGAPLIHSYAGLVTQVIRVPEYTDVRVAAGASLVAAPWDGSRGGLLAFLAKGLIQNEGALQASGAGFRGGVVPEVSIGFSGCATLPAAVRPGAGRGEGISSLDFGVWATGLENASNGGGGGLCPRAGGGGGGNGAAGGRGGDSTSYGDAARQIGGLGGAGLIYSLLDHLTLGGGGGQGYGGGHHSQGGAGGGAIFVRGYRLAGSGTILADGAAGEDARQGGAGGGGAGGSISLRIVDSVECGLISARGGHGGSSAAELMEDAGSGGGGGGGLLLYQAAKTISCPLYVEAGLAGGTTVTSPGMGAGAQPNGSELPAYRGTITRVASGFETIATTCTYPAPGFSQQNGQLMGKKPTFSGNLNATYAANDKLKISITGGSEDSGWRDVTPSGGTWRYDYPVPGIASSGQYVIKAVGSCKDGGNYIDSPNEATITVTVDADIPQIALTDPGSVTGPDVTFRFGVLNQEQSVTFTCKLDNITATQCGVWAPNQVLSRDLSGLSEAPHTFSVSGVDAAGNPSGTATHTWTVVWPPDTLIDTHPANPTNAQGAPFTFHASKPNATFKCRLDMGVWEACTSGKSYSNLAEGDHVFDVQAALGTIEDPSPASYSWVVDRAPPDTAIGQKPPDPSNNNRPTFTFTSTKPGGGFECSLNGQPYTSCPSPWTTPVLADARHTLLVRARDAAGNVDLSSASYSWSVDTTPPDTVIDQKPSNPSNDLTPSFAFNGTEAGSSFQCSLDSAAYTDCTSPFRTSVLTEGTHTFSVKAADVLGNRDLSAASYSWVVDKTPPDTALGNKPPNPSNNPRPVFTFSSSEPGNTFKCQMDQEEPVTCSSPWAPPSLVDGPHTFAVSALDAAGNTDPSPATYPWVVDTEAPDTVIEQKPPNPDSSSIATFTFRAEGTAIGFECSLDSPSYSPCSSPWTSPRLAEGNHTFSVRAHDAAGNTDLSPATYTWRVDTQAPDTTIDQKPPNPSNSTSATFTFSSTDAESSFECSLDGGAYASCTSPLPYSVAAGSHTFAVRAKDAAGNADLSPATYTWQMDLDAPDTTIGQKPLNPSNDANPTFTFSSTELGSTFECSLDSAPYSPCSSPAVFHVSEGPHTLSVRAKDAAGNRDPTPAMYPWVVDLTSPDAVIEEPRPRNPTNETSVTFRFSGAGAGGTYYCKLDEQRYVECPPDSITFTNLTPRVHTFSVYAVDSAGNDDLQNPATYTWEVDTEPPDTSIDQKPPNPTSQSSATFRFSGPGPGGEYWCSLDSQDYVACHSGTIAYTGLSNGEHLFKVYSKDAARNADESPAEYRWVVDSTPPETSILEVTEAGNIAGRNPTNSRSIKFRFSGADAPDGYWCRLESPPTTTPSTPPSTSTFNRCGGSSGTGTSGFQEYTGLGPGRHIFSVYAGDSAGNVDQTAGTYEWVVDLQAPVTTLVNPKTNTVTNIWRTNQPSPVFRGTSEPGSTVTLQIDALGTETYQMGSGGTWELATQHVLTDGKHTARVVEAADAVGNMWTPPNGVPLPNDSAFEFIVDRTPPETKIVQKPPVVHNSISVLFEFAAPNEELGLNTTFECKIVALHLDIPPFEGNCLKQQPYNLATVFEITNEDLKNVNGKYTLTVAARDEAGNLSENPQSYTFDVIVDPPDAPQILEPADGVSVYDLNPTVSGKTVSFGEVEFFLEVPSEDGATTVSKSVGLAKAGVDGSFNFRFSEPLAETSHVLTASVTDLASNPSPKSKPTTFSVFAPKDVAEAIGGGLGCAASSAEPWLALLGLAIGGVLRSRRRRR